MAVHCYQDNLFDTVLYIITTLWTSFVLDYFADIYFTYLDIFLPKNWWILSNLSEWKMTVYILTLYLLVFFVIAYLKAGCKSVLVLADIYQILASYVQGFTLQEKRPSHDRGLVSWQGSYVMVPYFHVNGNGYVEFEWQSSGNQDYYS